MTNKISIKEVSPKFSMMGWDILSYIKGRKKTVITLIGGVLGYVISNNEVIGILSAGLFEMGIGLIEYYLKKIE